MKRSNNSYRMVAGLALGSSAIMACATDVAPEQKPAAESVATTEQGLDLACAAFLANPIVIQALAVLEGLKATGTITDNCGCQTAFQKLQDGLQVLGKTMTSDEINCACNTVFSGSCPNAPPVHWVDNPLSGFTGSLPAPTATALHGYYGFDGSQHVNYISASPVVHVHELYYPPGGGWKDNDLENIAIQNGAIGDPTGSSLAGYWAPDGSQHVHYIDASTNHVHELYIPSGGQWKDNDLWTLVENAGGTASTARTGSALASYVTQEGDQHVNFVDPNNQVHELFYSRNGTHWVDNNLFSLAHVSSTIAASEVSITGYITSDNHQHVNFIDNDSGHVFELYYNGSSWIPNDLTGFAAGAVASQFQLAAYQSAEGSQHVIFFADFPTTVHELYFAAGGLFWKDNPLFTLVRNGGGTPVGPQTPTPLDAYASADGAQHVNYVDLNGDVRELYIPWGGTWVDNDLTSMISATSGKAADKPSIGSQMDGYVGGRLFGLQVPPFPPVDDGSQHVNFVDSSGNIREYFWQ